MKLEKAVLTLDEKDLAEPEAILLDQGRDGALEFLWKLRKRIVEVERRGLKTPVS